MTTENTKPAPKLRQVVLSGLDAQQILDVLLQADLQTSDWADARDSLEIAMAPATPGPFEARRYADLIDPFVRKSAPDHMTASCAAKTMRSLAARIEELEAAAMVAPPGPQELPVVGFLYEHPHLTAWVERERTDHTTLLSGTVETELVRRSDAISACYATQAAAAPVAPQPTPAEPFQGCYAISRAPIGITVRDVMPEAAAPVAPRMPQTPEDVRAFVGPHFSALNWGNPPDESPHEDDSYLLSAHDLLSAFRDWEDVAGAPVAQPQPDAIAAAVAAEREACAQVCEATMDPAEQERADQRARAAKDPRDQLDRLKHWSVVSTFNAGLRNAAKAIRARAQATGGANG